MAEINKSNITVEQARQLGESIAAAQRSKTPSKSGGATATPGSTPSNDEFLSNLQSRLIEQSDVISSSQSGIEESIQSAISGIEGSREANIARIESSAKRQETDFLRQGTRATTEANAARRGFATSTGVMKQIFETTDKQLKDLDMRKQELILSGEAEAASQIAALQLKELEFRQQSSQQVFSNLLSLSNFGMQLEQAEQERNKFEFGKEQAVGSIALQFGLEVRDGESLTSIIDRAKPFAAEDRRLELEAAQSQINLVNAQMADIESGKVTDINAAADAAIINPAILGNIKDFDVLTQVINKVSEKEATDVVPGLVNQAISNGDSLDDILADLASSGAVQNVPQAQSIARNLYANTSPAEAQSKIGDKSGSPLIDLLYGFSLTGAQGLTGLSEFTTGIGDPNADIFQDKF